MPKFKKSDFAMIAPHRLLWMGLHKENLDMVKLALQRKANPNTLSEEGIPPLVYLCEKVYLNKIKNWPDKYDNAFKTLIGHGADVNEKDPKGLSCLSYLISYFELDISISDWLTKDHGTPHRGSIERFSGINLNFLDWEPLTQKPFGAMMIFSTALKFILDKQSQKNAKALDWNVPLLIWNENQNSAQNQISSFDKGLNQVLRLFSLIHLQGFRNQDWDLLNFIPQGQALTWINMKNHKTTQTLLMYAVQKQNQSAIEALIKHGADVFQINDQG